MTHCGDRISHVSVCIVVRACWPMCVDGLIFLLICLLLNSWKEFLILSMFSSVVSIFHLIHELVPSLWLAIYFVFVCRMTCVMFFFSFAQVKACNVP